MSTFPTIPPGMGWPFVDATTGEFQSAAVNGALDDRIDSRAIRVIEAPLMPERYGAVGDGTTDDTAAFTAMAAVANASTGMPQVLLGERTYRTTAPIHITRAGWDFGGRSQARSRIVNSASAVFTFGAASAGSKHHFHDFWVSASAGHIFSVTNDAFYLNVIERLQLDAQGAGFSIFNQTGGNYIDNEVRNVDLYGTTGHTVPLWKVLSAIGGANSNSFRRGRSTYSGNYVFWFEETDSQKFTSQNTIQDWNFEITNGGCVMVKSANNWLIENCNVYDLAAFNGGVTTKDLFVITKSTGPNSRYNALKRVIRHGGTLGSGLVDIHLVTSSAPLNRIESCDLSSGSAGFVINMGTNSAIELNGLGANVSVQNRGSQSFAINGSTVGFFGATPVTKPTVAGAKGGNAALTSLLTQLAALGLITDSTS